jgi:cell wall-associated protease
MIIKKDKMLLKKLFYLFILFFMFGCSSINQNIRFSNNKIMKKVIIEEGQLNNWQNKDIITDTIAGISIDKTYQELIKNKKGKTVIVAVLDTELDIVHEDLKDAIWRNKKEIPNNGIDDDKNGYLDDINGWNFLGNVNDKAILYQNLSSTRVIRHFKKQFEKNGGKEKFSNKKDSLLYEKALTVYKQELEEITQRKQMANFYIEGYPKALKTLKEFFPDEKYTYNQVDSLYKLHENDKNREQGSPLANIYFIRDVFRNKLSQQVFDDYKKSAYDEFNTTFNDSYHDKDITGDDEENINDTHYGNNNISKNAKLVYHATQVSGLIGANRENKIGIQGFSQNIKLMPVCIIANNGDDVDKDQALAIRYATDNGAKVINMSLSKSFSVHPDWLKDALLYAQQKDVLVIISAGNDSEDEDKNGSFPRDYDEDTGIEFCNNLITVGATTYMPNVNFLADFTNYGKKNVDVFAPGQDLYTTDATSGYVRNMGTSLACAITSGTAALIRSYYPKLTAAQVKQIILDSGVAYDNLQVQVPGEKEGVLKPFSEMSKSGKVVNAYNALLMAKEVCRK